MVDHISHELNLLPCQDFISGLRSPGVCGDKNDVRMSLTQRPTAVMPNSFSVDGVGYI